MKISAFVSITKPEERQDIWFESIASVMPWADEVVIIDGAMTEDEWMRNNVLLIKKFGYDVFADEKMKHRMLPWPEDFSWEELPKHLNKGLGLCTGDWAVRFDIDYVFKDDVKNIIRQELHRYRDKRVVTCQKFSLITVDKAYQKGPVPMIINRKFKDMKFGMAEKYTDLCYPIIQEGLEKGVPIGKLPKEKDVGRGHMDFYNYDYTFKTKDFTKHEFHRFSMAHKKFFGEAKWGKTEEESYEKFINMMAGRTNRHIYPMEPKDHPSFIQQKVKDILPEQFGHSAWGEIN